jgi:hypothetical protein
MIPMPGNVSLNLQDGPAKAEGSNAAYGVESAAGAWIINMKGQQNADGGGALGGLSGYLPWVAVGVLVLIVLKRKKGGT